MKFTEHEIKTRLSLYKVLNEMNKNDIQDYIDQKLQYIYGDAWECYLDDFPTLASLQAGGTYASFYDDDAMTSLQLNIDRDNGIQYYREV